MTSPVSQSGLGQLNIDMLFFWIKDDLRTTIAEHFEHTITLFRQFNVTVSIVRTFTQHKRINDTNERLVAAIGGLDERSKNILVQRWLSEEKATLHELAAEYQVSAERIRQLEKNAMKKVRAVLEA